MSHPERSVQRFRSGIDDVNVAWAYGGTDMRAMGENIKKGCDILFVTEGRMCQLLEQKAVSLPSASKRLTKCCGLDQAGSREVLRDRRSGQDIRRLRPNAEDPRRHQGEAGRFLLPLSLASASSLRPDSRFLDSACP